MGSSAQNSSGVHWCRRRVRLEKVWEALVQSQVRFNKVPEKVPEKVWEAPGQVQQGSGEGFGEGSRKPWCKAKSGSTGPGEGCREGPGEGFGGIFGAGRCIRFVLGRVQQEPTSK